MTLAINTVDGDGLSNDARHELLPKKTKVILLLKSFIAKVLEYKSGLNRRNKVLLCIP